MSGLAAPVPIALDVAPRHLKQTVGAVICDDLLGNTPGTANLVAVLAVEQVLEGVEAVGRARRSRVEGPLEGVELLRGARGGGIAVAVAGEVGRIGAGALDIGVGSQCSHREGRSVAPSGLGPWIASFAEGGESRRVVRETEQSRHRLGKQCGWIMGPFCDAAILNVTLRLSGVWVGTLCGLPKETGAHHSRHGHVGELQGERVEALRYVAHETLARGTYRSLGAVGLRSLLPSLLSSTYRFLHPHIGESQS